MKHIKLTNEHNEETEISIDRKDSESYLEIRQDNGSQFLDAVFLTKSEAIVLMNALKEAISG